MATKRHVSWSTHVSLVEATPSLGKKSLQSQSQSQSQSSQPQNRKPSSLKESSYSVPANNYLPNSTSLLSSTTTGLANSIISKHAERISDSREKWESWRRYGKLYRETLVKNDEESGGNTFALSNNCSIEKYYQVAERVLDQFMNKSLNNRVELDESYLVGTRLVKFLSTVLPTHVDYFVHDLDLDEMRAESQLQLVQLLQYLEQLALIIDEDEQDKYLANSTTEHSYRIDSQPRHSPDSSSSSFLYGEMTMESASTLNTTFDTTATTFEGDLDVIDNDFFKAQESHRLALQQEEANAWDAMFSLQCCIQKPSPPHAASTNQISSAAEWDPNFPLSFGPAPLPSISSRSQQPTVIASNTKPKGPPLTIQTTPTDSGMYSKHVVETPSTINAPNKEEIARVVTILNHSGGQIRRKSSPKSVTEFSEWGFEDQMKEISSLQYNLPDDRSLTPDGEEELSLTSLTNGGANRRRKQNQLSKLKGCIRCLLD